MTRHEKLTGRAAKLERTQEAFMEGVHGLIGRGAWSNVPPHTWSMRIGFGPPHCSSLGPSRRRQRESRPGMIHTVTVPESWLEDVYAPGLAVVNDSLILAAAPARCDNEGFEAWGVVAMLRDGRKMRAARDLYVVRFGGRTEIASSVELAFGDIQQAIHVELGLAEAPLPF
jgi:hypothetical protein